MELQKRISNIGYNFYFAYIIHWDMLMIFICFIDIFYVITSKILCTPSFLSDPPLDTHHRSIP